MRLIRLSAFALLALFLLAPFSAMAAPEMTCHADLSAPLPDFLRVEEKGAVDGIEPGIQCLAGWCSSNSQCEEWVGPGSVCSKKPGASCGLCTLEA